MTIYFAASISGGRGDQAIYQQIVDLLKQHGTVLTEHFASAALTSAGESLSDRAIHDRDIDWLRSADVLVAEGMIAGCQGVETHAYASVDDLVTILQKVFSI